MTGPNYRTQNGCRNCRNAFVMAQYDDPDYLYCTLGAPPRPKCCSRAMNEEIRRPPGVYGEAWLKIVGEAHRAWDEWADGREVSEQGICDAWEAIP